MAGEGRVGEGGGGRGVDGVMIGVLSTAVHASRCRVLNIVVIFLFFF